MLQCHWKQQSGTTCMYLTHIVSLCAVRVYKVWGFLRYSQLLWHLRDEQNRQMTEGKRGGAHYHFFKRDKENETLSHCLCCSYKAVWGKQLQAKSKFLLRTIVYLSFLDPWNKEQGIRNLKWGYWGSSEGWMHTVGALTAAAASSLRINPQYNPLGTLLRSQINPERV